MKKKFTLTCLFVIGLSMNMMAQSSDDTVAVLQKCIDLPVLQQYYQLKDAGHSTRLYIRQYPVSFYSKTELSGNGKEVYFMKPSGIVEKEITEYFMFRTFNINQNSAYINFNYFYNYDYASKQFKMVSVNIEMQKTEALWNVANISLKGDTK